MPLDVDQHTLELLEFDKIRERLLGFTLSEPGRSALRENEFETDQTLLQGRLAIVSEIQILLTERDRRPEGDIPTLGPFLSSARHEGSVLEPEELNEIARFLRGVRTLQEWLFQESEGTARSTLRGDLAGSPELERRIRSYIDQDGSIKEDAIPELRAIRKEIARTHGEIDEIVRSYFQRGDKDRIFTSDVPTQRDGRTVLPLSADHRSKIQGIVHEVSQSGATLFVEPEPLVRRNNALVELQGRAFQAIRRALRLLTEEVRGQINLLMSLEEYVATLDGYYARALYGNRIEGHPPTEAGAEGTLVLVKARHPLLGSDCVPISIEVEKKTRALIVTGPNTGGKTVSLKTVGLFALMHQFGIPLPAEDGTVMPIFHSIYADIGDEQSLEESLSTFSGHMRRISFVLSRADRESLVLLDELGSGTDYEEGAALSMAILDTFISRARLTIVTTHHTVLKHYGFTREEAENVSVSFDTTTHRPTFQLRVGEPGASHALEIASQNGIGPELIEQAERYLEEHQSDAAEIIRQLTEEHNLLQERRRELEEEQRRYARQEELLREEREALREKEEELRREGIRDIRTFAAEARKRLENLVRELREGEITREKTQKVKEYIQELEAKEEGEAARLSREYSPTEEALRKAEERRGGRRGKSTAAGDREDRGATGAGAHRRPREYREGDEVVVTANGRRATLLRRNKDGSWLVAAGPIKLSLDPQEFEPLLGKKGREVSVSYEQGSGAAPVAELDLRGQRLQDALKAVDDQIDRAVLSGMQRFGIIHGMGEGVLQKGVRSHLADHEAVDSFSYATPEEGGFGKTIVELRG
jgi:DNA mismatch repair protein MutS2